MYSKLKNCEEQRLLTRYLCILVYYLNNSYCDLRLVSCIYILFANFSFIFQTCELSVVTVPV